MRLKFLILFFFILNSFLIYSQLKNEGVNQSTLHTIATAHFDTQWEWTIKNSIDEYLEPTLTKNFKLFEEFPSYKFSFEGAFRYMLAKEYFPQHWEKLKKYINEGRWNICGSSLDAGDVNIPSPEAIMRLTLLGQDYFYREFGVRSRDVFIPDCFGFGYALPSIASHCGLKGFSTQKLTWGSAVGVPFDIGAWQGVDGSKIFAALNAGDYTAKLTSDLSRDEKWIKTVQNTGNNSGIYFGYRYFGVGDRGGAPDRLSVEWLQKSIQSDGPLKIVSVPADLMCKQITTEQLNKLPQYNGELLATFHGTGCYTAISVMKRWNRKNELLADYSERASVMAQEFKTVKYPQLQINEAWTRFIWHQFHDDLTGTSIPDAYGFSYNDEIISMNQFAGILENAAGGVIQNLNTKDCQNPVVVYNPLSTTQENIAEAFIPFNALPKALKVVDSQGNEVPSQIISGDDDGVKIIFLAKIAPLAFETFDVQKSEKVFSSAENLKITNNTLENNNFKVTINESGEIASIIDKFAKKEVLTEPNQWEMFNDTSSIFPAWEIIYNQLKFPRTKVKEVVKIEIVEKGPIRVKLKVSRVCEDSRFNHFISLSTGEAGKKVDVDNHVVWNNKNTLLKSSFKINVVNSLATYDLGLGTIQRGNNTEKLYEVPAQQWADISSTDLTYGVSILNDCKYGWDKPNDNTIRLTLLHTPNTNGNHRSDQENLDQGKHQFLYSIYPHAGDWRKANTSWEAAKVNQPLLTFTTTKHDGSLGKKFSFGKLNTDQVMMKAMKKAENTDEIIVRFQELYGQNADNVVFTTNSPIKTIRELNGIEEEIAIINPQDGKLCFSMQPYKPRTFAIRLEPMKNEAQYARSEVVTIPYNKDFISFDDNKKDGGINGISLPAEVFPKEIIYNGINFKLGPSDNQKNNMLICQNNKLTFSNLGKNERIYFLVSSLKNDKLTEFKINGKAYTFMVQSAYENVGSWYRRSNVYEGRWPKSLNGLSMQKDVIVPAWIKKDKIAWYSTHLHNDTMNISYEFCYFYCYDFPTDGKDIELQLPNDPDIVISAISLGSTPSQGTRIAQDIYDNYEKDTKVIISIASGEQVSEKSKEIKIECSDSQASIYYTVNGKEPNESSFQYTKPFRIDTTTIIKVVAYKNGFAAGLSVSMSIIKLAYMQAQNIKGNLTAGLSCNIYDGKWSSIPKFNELTPVSTTICSNFDIPDHKLKTDFFGLRFEGFLNIEKEDIYTFYLNSDDGSKLYIDDKEVIINDGLHGVTEKAFIVKLGKGYHKIKLKYFDNWLGEHLKLEYSSRSFVRKAIESRNLLH